MVMTRLSGCMGASTNNIERLGLSDAEIRDWIVREVFVVVR